MAEKTSYQSIPEYIENTPATGEQRRRMRALYAFIKKLAPQAQALWQTLSKEFMVDFDEAGSIGKRYRRQDEIGTPYCITVDFQTVGDDATPADLSVTVRERDSMQQERIPMAELVSYLREKVSF